MPVTADKVLASGNTVRVRMEIQDGIGTMTISYKREPSAEDKAEVNHMLAIAHATAGYEEIKDN